MYRIGKLGKALLFVALAAFGAGALGISEDAQAAPQTQSHYAKAKHKKARKKPAKHVAHKVKHVKPAKHARHKAKRGHTHPIGS